MNIQLYPVATYHSTDQKRKVESLTFDVTGQPREQSATIALYPRGWTITRKIDGWECYQDKAYLTWEEALLSLHLQVDVAEQFRPGLTTGRWTGCNTYISAEEVEANISDLEPQEQFPQFVDKVSKEIDYRISIWNFPTRDCYFSTS